MKKYLPHVTIFMNGFILFMAKKKLHFVCVLFEMSRRSNTSLDTSLGSGSSILVSETHRVLHESRLITLLSETIHKNLPRITLLTDVYREFFYSARITSLKFIASFRFTIFLTYFITH